MRPRRGAKLTRNTWSRGPARRRICRRAAALLLAIGIVLPVVLSVAIQPASAAVGLDVSVSFPSPVTVGDTGLTGTVTISNASTGIDGNGGIRVTSITLVPSCGDGTVTVDCPVASWDPGVFQITSATGTSGAVCSGRVHRLADRTARRRQGAARSPRRFAHHLGKRRPAPHLHRGRHLRCHYKCPPRPPADRASGWSRRNLRPPQHEIRPTARTGTGHGELVHRGGCRDPHPVDYRHAIGPHGHRDQRHRHAGAGRQRGRGRPNRHHLLPGLRDLRRLAPGQLRWFR